nr:C5 protein [Malvastrum yellow vein Baoshan virus]
MEKDRANYVCRYDFRNKIRSLLISVGYRIVEIDPNLKGSVNRIRGMGTCHIQHQGILGMILVLPSLLLVINNIIINPNKLLNQSLFLCSILSTSDGCIPLPQDLVTISMHILHSRSARLVVKHVENLPKILRRAGRTSISDKKEHDIVRVILALDVLIHPYLTQHVD